MIVVDANYFLRYLTQPVTPQDVVMERTANRLFDLTDAGEETFTRTDAVVAEVVFALHRHYGMFRSTIAARLRATLGAPGCRMPTNQHVLLALDLWESTPKVSWVEALLVAHARESGLSLATFDGDVIRLPDLSIWQPPVSNSGAN